MGVGVRFQEFEIQVSVDLDQSKVRAEFEMPLAYMLKINGALAQAQQVLRFAPHLRGAIPYIEKIEQALQTAIADARKAQSAK